MYLRQYLKCHKCRKENFKSHFTLPFCKIHSRVNQALCINALPASSSNLTLFSFVMIFSFTKNEYMTDSVNNLI